MADNSNNSSNRGFAAMSEKERKQRASEGGRASGGQFKSGDKRTSDAGKKGAANQPTEAKRRGGENSHRSQ